MNTAVKGEMSPGRAGLEGPQVTERNALFEKAKKNARRKSEDRHKMEGYALSSGKKEASLCMKRVLD